MCAMCMLSTSYAKDEAGLESLQQLVTQWQRGVALGDLTMLLPLYVRADQAKVTQALPYVKTGQATLPFAAVMVDGRWLMRGDDIQEPDPRTISQVEPLATITTPAISVQAVVPASVTMPVSSMQVQTYSLGMSDQNFRKVLTRWANVSGWMFEPEHWSVARDIPVSGVDSVVSDFKTAVRRLLKSTLLTDLPVQPCFYSNKVLRVIPASELCSRSEH